MDLELTEQPEPSVALIDMDIQTALAVLSSIALNLPPPRKRLLAMS